MDSQRRRFVPAKKRGRYIPYAHSQDRPQVATVSVLRDRQSYFQDQRVIFLEPDRPPDDAEQTTELPDWNRQLFATGRTQAGEADRQAFRNLVCELYASLLSQRLPLPEERETAWYVPPTFADERGPLEYWDEFLAQMAGQQEPEEDLSDFVFRMRPVHHWTIRVNLRYRGPAKPRLVVDEADLEE